MEAVTNYYRERNIIVTDPFSDRLLFAVEIDGHPTLAFDASSVEVAKGICLLSEFREDLGRVTCDGQRIFRQTSVISVRGASACEAATFYAALKDLGPTAEISFVFLSKVDRITLAADEGAQPLPDALVTIRRTHPSF